MRSVLMIAFLFPPSSSIGAKRPLRFARRLPDHGWRPLVLTAPLGTPAERDDSLLGALPPGLRVERSYAPGWMWAARNLGDTLDRRLRPQTGARAAGGATGGAGGRLAGWAQRAADRFVPLDGDVAYLPHALVAASRLVAAERPDALCVSAYPYSALVLGALLKRRHGVPLICELRDPWTMNVEFRPRHPAVAALERRLERWVFETADRVVVTTDAVREAYARLYPHLPADRLRRIYSSYDEGLAPGAPADPDGPFTIVHFGSLYGPRRALPLLRAMARLKAERSLERGAVRLLVFGRLDHPDDHAAVRALGLEGDVTVRGKIPYAEGLAALRRADVLYLPAFGEETFYIPGKLYDYFLAGRPILCETASPEMEAILERTGTGVCFRRGDEDAVLAHLRRALDARHGGPSLARPVRAEIERFSTEA
ncbi:MAG: glycosyltransferase, partial [Deltaproteobacteria bacterium]|nr:glycosyltransferase [Deltaproteobacteria bacterium]